MHRVSCRIMIEEPFSMLPIDKIATRLRADVEEMMEQNQSMAQQPLTTSFTPRKELKWSSGMGPALKYNMVGPAEGHKCTSASGPQRSLKDTECTTSKTHLVPRHESRSFCLIGDRQTHSGSMLNNHHAICLRALATIIIVFMVHAESPVSCIIPQDKTS